MNHYFPAGEPLPRPQKIAYRRAAHCHPYDLLKPVRGLMTEAESERRLVLMIDKWFSERRRTFVIRKTGKRS